MGKIRGGNVATAEEVEKRMIEEIRTLLVSAKPKLGEDLKVKCTQGKTIWRVSEWTLKHWRQFSLLVKVKNVNALEFREIKASVQERVLALRREKFLWHSVVKIEYVME